MSRVSHVNSTHGRAVEQQTLLLCCPDANSISVDYAIQRARECRTFGAAIEACAKAAGLDLDKEVSGPLGFDPAQLSRWQAGTEGIKWEKLARVMGYCGNNIPLLWMLIQGGYDPHSLRLSETAAEKRAREANERADKAESTLAIVLATLAQRSAA